MHPTTLWTELARTSFSDCGWILNELDSRLGLDAVCFELSVATGIPQSQLRNSLLLSLREKVATFDSETYFQKTSAIAPEVAIWCQCQLIRAMLPEGDFFAVIRGKLERALGLIEDFQSYDSFDLHILFSAVLALINDASDDIRISSTHMAISYTLYSCERHSSGNNEGFAELAALEIKEQYVYRKESFDHLRESYLDAIMTFPVREAD